MNPRSTFSFNGKRHLSQVVESVQPLREAPCGHRLTGTAFHGFRQTLKLFVSTISLCGNDVFVNRFSFFNADMRWRSGYGQPPRD